jgi:hypothetical protein
MPNLYKTKAMQKYISKVKDEIYPKTGMKRCTRALYCGLSGSGKTNGLMQYIEACEDVFDKIYLCYKTDEPFYDLLIDQLTPDGLIEVFKTVESFPSVNDFPDESQFVKNKERVPNILIIFDDCLSDCKIGKNNLKMREFFTYGRKKCLNIAFLTQSYFQTEKYFRDQMNYLILTSIASDKDLKRICNEYGLGKISPEVLMDAYELIKTNDVDNDLDFLKIDLHGNCPIEHKLSRNFLDYLQIEL